MHYIIQISYTMRLFSFTSVLHFTSYVTIADLTQNAMPETPKCSILNKQTSYYEINCHMNTLFKIYHTDAIISEII